MRYAQRGGYTPAEQQRRERLRLEAELRKGPLAHGFAGDQRWTLGRIKTLIGKLFHVGYTVEGTWKLMRRGHLVAAQAVHGQLRRRRPGRPGPHHQAQAQEDPVPPPPHPRLPGRHRPENRTPAIQLILKYLLITYSVCLG